MESIQCVPIYLCQFSVLDNANSVCASPAVPFQRVAPCHFSVCQFSINFAKPLASARVAAYGYTCMVSHRQPPMARHHLGRLCCFPINEYAQTPEGIIPGGGVPVVDGLVGAYAGKGPGVLLFCVHQPRERFRQLSWALCVDTISCSFAQNEMNWSIAGSSAGEAASA